MGIRIETRALKTLLYAILSCKCPVTPFIEQKLFVHFNTIYRQETADFFPILAIVDENPERTPIHNLLDLCICSRDDPREFTITQNDMLRYLGSVSHYNMVVANNPGIEFANPGFLLSHLLMPVTLGVRKQVVTAIYEREGNRICFEPVAVPEELVSYDGKHAIHMGTLLCSLTGEQAQMLHIHQSLIKGFAPAVSRVDGVDFRNLPPLGDHFSQVLERMTRNRRTMSWAD